MILTLTPNPAIDITLTTTNAQCGQTNVVAPARRRAGGKGLNVARILTEQQFPTLALAPVGREDLAWFSLDLGAVAHQLVPCAGPTRSSYAFVETGADVTTIFNETGAPRSRQEWEELLSALRDQITIASCLVLSGSLPPQSPPDAVARIVRIGKDAGVPVVVDVHGPALLAAARAGADVLKPNRQELAQAVGEMPVVKGARQLQRLGAGLVVVSLGADGLLVVPPDAGAAVVTARLPQPLRGNPTGAGDAAVAATAALVAAGDRDPETIARRATAWSAAAVLVPWAGSIHPDHRALERAVVLSTS